MTLPDCLRLPWSPLRPGQVVATPSGPATVRAVVRGSDDDYADWTVLVVRDGRHESYLMWEIDAKPRGV